MVRDRRAAFTLVELLVVIGVIALLISILMPVLSKARERALEVNCKNNVRQIYYGCLTFSVDNKGRLPRPSIIGETAASDPAMDSVCVWAMKDTGVADFDVGGLWRYISPSTDIRQRIVNCPSDLVGRDKPHLGGYLNIDRNFSYSFNANILADLPTGEKRAIRLSDVVKPAEKIMIYEELGPNDAWCLSPMSNMDDYPSGRHGNDKSFAVGTNGYANAGRGNHGFFDGHVEGLPPKFIINSDKSYQPLITRD